MRFIAGTVVGNGACHICHLQRCDCPFALTDRTLQHLTDSPVGTQFCKGFLIGQMTGSIAGFQSGGLSQTKLGGIFGDAVNGQFFGQLIEEDIAGNPQCLCHGNVAVRTGTVVVMILEMIGMTAEIGAVSGDDLFVQTCRCRNGLERGTRTVQTVCGTVDQRRVFRIENGFIVHLIVFQIIGGSSYHAQHAGSFRVQHYDCPAGNLFQSQLFGFGIPQAVEVVDKAV